MNNFEIGRAVGHVTAYGLIAVVIIFVVYKFIKKNWKKTQGSVPRGDRSSGMK